MEATIQFPRGLTQLVEFRRLALLVGGKHQAIAAVWHLFSHLANSAQAGRLGELPARDHDLLRAELADRAEFDGLVEAGWLVDCGGTLGCPQFVAHNRHLDPGHKDTARRGGDLKSLNGKLRRAEERGMAQLALLPRDTWTVGDGADARLLTAEEIRQVTLLIVGLDGVLGRRERASHEADWPNDLVRAAWTVLQATPPALAMKVVREITRLGFDQSPLVPRTTELALPRFGALLEMVRRHPEHELGS